MQDMNSIYEKYIEIVYKYVFCLTGNKDTAEEIVQETFLVAVKDIKKFRGRARAGDSSPSLQGGGHIGEPSGS